MTRDEMLDALDWLLHVVEDRRLLDLSELEELSHIAASVADARMAVIGERTVGKVKVYHLDGELVGVDIDGLRLGSGPC